MLGQRFPKSIFPVLLIVFLILAGAQIACALLSPAPQDATKVPAVMPTASPSAPKLDRADFQSVLRWVVFSILQNRPEMIADVIGEHGARFWPYATEGEFLGHRDAEVIVNEIRKGLMNSSPQCLGYNPDFGSQPDKAIIFFKGINFDRKDVGFAENEGEIVSFQFFRLEQGWELVYITPVPEEAWPELEGALSGCP